MTFDLRLAIGLLFLSCGLVLLLHGIVVGAAVLGINVNLWWGAVLILFGALMSYLGRPKQSQP
jgi:hypothetical protein